MRISDMQLVKRSFEPQRVTHRLRNMLQGVSWRFESRTFSQYLLREVRVFHT